jgi:hypothetical protein
MYKPIIQKIIFISSVFFIANAQAANQKPIADAGIDQTVVISNNVTLSAVKSSDADGEIKTYQWLQTKGTKVVLKNLKTIAPTFTSPKKADTLIFKLTVIDDKKATAFDTVTINVVTQIQGQLNDTGITSCSDGAFNVASCGISTYPRQDAEFGRDFFNDDDKDGHAGFSFSKISATDKQLPLDATEWACVKDNVTGLLRVKFFLTLKVI